MSFEKCCNFHPNNFKFCAVKKSEAATHLLKHKKYSEANIFGSMIIGDSMITGVDETMISKKGGVPKIRSFSRAKVEDMCDYLKPIKKAS